MRGLAPPLPSPISPPLQTKYNILTKNNITFLYRFYSTLDHYAFHSVGNLDAHQGDYGICINLGHRAGRGEARGCSNINFVTPTQNACIQMKMKSYGYLVTHH